MHTPCNLTTTSKEYWSMSTGWCVHLSLLSSFSVAREVGSGWRSHRRTFMRPMHINENLHITKKEKNTLIKVTKHTEREFSYSEPNYLFYASIHLKPAEVRTTCKWNVIWRWILSQSISLAESQKALEDDGSKSWVANLLIVFPIH